MNARITRRAALGLSPLALASCSRREQYFGKLTPPARQSLIYEIAFEPSGLDPASSVGASEVYISQSHAKSC
jgi:hypothetical protein